MITALLLAAAALDLLLSNARVLTQDPARPEADAIGIRGDRIIVVGADADVARAAGPSTQRLDLRGAFVLPDSSIPTSTCARSANSSRAWTCAASRAPKQ